MDWYYTPVLFGLNLISTIIFVIMPVVCVLLAFFLKRKYLWTAPILSTILAAIIGIISSPSILTNNEHRTMFFGISIPIQFAVAVALTGIVYVISFILKRRRNS